MAQARKSKELDHYLKNVISGVPKKLDHFLEGREKKLTYYTGNWATDVMNNFTEKQYLSLEKVLKKWKSLYPGAKIVGHRDTGNTDKTCPNFDVKTWAKDKFI